MSGVTPVLSVVASYLVVSRSKSRGHRSDISTLGTKPYQVRLSCPTTHVSTVLAISPHGVLQGFAAGCRVLRTRPK